MQSSFSSVDLKLLKWSLHNSPCCCKGKLTRGGRDFDILSHFFPTFPPASCCDTSEKVYIGWNPRITLYQLLNSHFKATIMISISVMSTTTMSVKAWRVLSLLRMTAAAENYKYKNAFYTFLNSKYNSWWVKNVLITLAFWDELVPEWIM